MIVEQQGLMESQNDIREVGEEAESQAGSSGIRNRTPATELENIGGGLAGPEEMESMIVAAEEMEMASGVEELLQEESFRSR